MDGPFGDDGGTLPPILAVKTDTRGRQLIANNGHRRSFARRRGRASAISRNGKLWNVSMGLHQSGLMFASRITFPHFSVSSNMNFPKSEDVIDIGSIWNFQPRFLGQSGLAPDELITAPHLSVSSATNFPKLAAEPGDRWCPDRQAVPSFWSRNRDLISLFSVLTISMDLFLGKPAPNHWLAS